MKRASIASQLPGRPGGFGGGFVGRPRRAREYSLVSSDDNKPVWGSMRLILIPSQKLPKASQARPSSSIIKFGSIALKLSSARERKTSPRSTQRKSELFGFRVLL